MLKIDKKCVLLWTKEQYFSYEQLFDDIEEAFDKYNELKVNGMNIQWLVLNVDMDKAMQWRIDKLIGIK